GPGELGGLLAERVAVHVAQGDDVAELAGVGDVAGALAADADPGEPEPVVAPGDPGGRAGLGGEEVPGRRGGGEEPAAGHGAGHRGSPRGKRCGVRASYTTTDRHVQHLRPAGGGGQVISAAWVV